MGQKGDKHSKEAELTAKLFAEKLSSINGITSKKMFGGHGIFHEGEMFGIIDSNGNAFLKTDEKSEANFIEKGSVKHGKMPYHSVPDEVFNSCTLLIEYARRAIDLAK